MSALTELLAAVESLPKWKFLAYTVNHAGYASIKSALKLEFQTDDLMGIPLYLVPRQKHAFIEWNYAESLDAYLLAMNGESL